MGSIGLKSKPLGKRLYLNRRERKAGWFEDAAEMPSELTRIRGDSVWVRLWRSLCDFLKYVQRMGRL